MRINFLWIALLIMIFAAGCVKAETGVVTIQKNMDSDHVKSFDKLHLGELNEYKYILPKNKQVRGDIVVELYEDGVKQNNTTSLSLGWEKDEQRSGDFGMGILENPEGDPGLILYSPDSTLRTSNLKDTKWTDLSIRGWQDGVGEKELTLEPGESYVLGAYKGTASNETRNYVLSNETELEEMLNSHEFVLLLKVSLFEQQQS